MRSHGGCATWAVAQARDARAHIRCAVQLQPTACQSRTKQLWSWQASVSDRVDTIATLAGRPLISNRGIPLNLDWVQQVRVNTSAVERRAQSHVARRTVKKDWQAAWLLRAVSCMDLTTLSGDDTEERVRRLCAKARHPIQEDLVKRLGIEELDIKVAAVCVYHTFVETAVRALEGSGVRVAAVSTGFPAGPLSADRAGGGDSSFGGGRGERYRCGHHSRPCVRRQVAGALRRDRGFQTGQWIGSHESHSGRRRFAHVCAMWLAPASSP